MIQRLAALALASVLGGCTGTAALVDALAKDPAANCISVSTPYGSINVARATPGVRVTLSAGSCSVDSTGSAALR